MAANKALVAGAKINYEATKKFIKVCIGIVIFSFVTTRVFHTIVPKYGHVMFEEKHSKSAITY